MKSIIIKGPDAKLLVHIIKTKKGWASTIDKEIEKSGITIKVYWNNGGNTKIL